MSHAIQGDPMKYTPDTTKIPNRAVIYILMAALVALLTSALVFAASAGAQSRFVYETCDPTLPFGNPPPTEFHAEYLETGESDPNYESFQTCAIPEGSIGIKHIGDGAGFAVLDTVIQNTPGGWVESLTMSASAGNFHGTDSGEVSLGGSRSWPVPGTGDSTRSLIVRPQPPSGGELGWSRFLTFLGCLFTCEEGAYVAAHFIAATEVDPTPPVVTTVEGTLVAGDVLRGHQTVGAQADDVGGGVRSLELRIDGIAVPGTAAGACSIAWVSNPSYKGVVATTPTPCPPSLSGAWNLDTAAPPFQNGPNTVQVCAADFSTTGAPNTSCSAPRTVQVDNTCTESSVPGGADLSAGFGKGGADDLTVGFGSGTEITGDLTDQAGDPISGATICLQSQPADSATAPQAVGTVTTDDQGDFSMEVRPGANRQLLVGYRHDSFQIEKKLSLGTRARPTLTLSRHKIRGGRKVEITGRLPRPNPGGHVLVLQGSSATGTQWETFKKVTTSREGRYRTLFWFAKPRRATTFRVRAVSPAQAGYDYDPGASKASRIRVRP
jgi:hypothetical protein